MKYTTFMENVNHLVRIIKKLDDNELKCIYFTKINGNVYMSALNGHIMPMYKIRACRDNDTSVEEANFNVAFSYNSNLENLIKACKKNPFIIFDSESKTLTFDVGGNPVIVNEYNDKVNIEQIVKRAEDVLKSEHFNVTSAVGKMTYDKAELVFPTKNGVVTFYGNTESLSDVMLARWTENSDFCALVMPMVHDSEEANKDNIDEIKKFFNV